MSKATPPDLGRTLQHLRKKQNLTLDKLAEKSGVSKSMLSQIERGQTNPTFATLWHLTAALGTEISDLLEASAQGDTTPVMLEHLQSHFTPSIRSPDGKCTLKILSPVSTVSHLEWYDFTLLAGGCLDSAPHADGTVEHLTCQLGHLVIIVGENRFEIAEGETLRYRADLPHTIENTTQQTVRAILVVATRD